MIKLLKILLCFVLVMSILAGCEAQSSESDHAFQFGQGDYQLRSGIKTYLLLGVDTEGSLQEKKEPGLGGQSDAIYLLVCDMEKKSARLVGIPRDTMTEIRVFLPSGKDNGTSVDHLTLQYAFGDGGKKSCELTKESVSSLLYGLPIDGYLAINLGAVPDLAEALGGVTVTVPDDTAADEDPSFVKGNTVTLDRSNVKRFLRFRDTEVSQSAVSRMERHKAFFKGCAKRLKEIVAKNPAALLPLYQQYGADFVTDLAVNDLVGLAGLDFEETIEILPGEFTEGAGYDEFYVDEEALQEMILRVFCE